MFCISTGFYFSHLAVFLWWKYVNLPFTSIVLWHYIYAFSILGLFLKQKQDNYSWQIIGLCFMGHSVAYHWFSAHKQKCNISLLFDSLVKVWHITGVWLTGQSATYHWCLTHWSKCDISLVFDSLVKVWHITGVWLTGQSVTYHWCLTHWSKCDISLVFDSLATMLHITSFWLTGQSVTYH